MQVNSTGQTKTLIILGMHRSGTSLITHWLYNCGLEIGARLLGPGLGNSEGHFEDIEFYKLHLEILRENNLDDSGIIYHTAGEIKSAHKEKIKNLVESKSSQFLQWGWKEPRTCLFLNVYREILPEAYYLIIFRDYHFVVVSLLKRSFAEIDAGYENAEKSFFSKLTWKKIRRKLVFRKFCQQRADEFLKVWIFYNEKIIKNIKTLPSEKYLVLNYSVLNEKDTEIISLLVDNWNFSLTYTKFSEIFKPSLFSKPFNIDKYIKDKQLVAYANQLSKSLMEYVKN
jgi:hypothetical protein